MTRIPACLPARQAFAGMTKQTAALSALACFLFGLIITAAPSVSWAGKGDNPTIIETDKGRALILPPDLKNFLGKEFPKARIPSDSEFNKEMRKFYFSHLIGIHPAIAWGDFNKDKKKDYILLLVTGQTNWGPIVELVILNGGKSKSVFEVFRLGEVINFKDSYVSFRDAKLIKGTYQKGGWYLNWEPKDQNYSLIKS